jgi:hypothetical protein
LHLLGWRRGAGPVRRGRHQLALDALSAGSQIRSQLIAFAGSLGAHLVQRLLCIGANPSDFSLGGAGSGLGTGCLLLGLLGGGLGVGCRLTDPDTVSRGGLGTLPGLGKGPRYRGIAFLLGGDGTLPDCVREGLGGGQVLTHLLGGGIGPARSRSAVAARCSAAARTASTSASAAVGLVRVSIRSRSRPPAR